MSVPSRGCWPERGTVVPVKQVLRATDFFTLSDHASTEVGVPKLAQNLPQMQMKSVHSCRLTQTEHSRLSQTEFVSVGCYLRKLR